MSELILNNTHNRNGSRGGVHSKGKIPNLSSKANLPVRLGNTHMENTELKINKYSSVQELLSTSMLFRTFKLR